MDESGATPSRTARSWWDRHHRVALGGAAGVTLGLAIGFWIGSAATACRSGATCDVSWGAVEAIGTWVGALGGAIALLIGFAGLRSSQQAADEERQMRIFGERQRRQDEFSRANRVSVRFGGVQASEDGKVELMQYQITNSNTRAEVHQITVAINPREVDDRYRDQFRKIGELKILGPSSSHSFTLGFVMPRDEQTIESAIKAGALLSMDTIDSAGTRATDRIQKAARLRFLIDDVTWERLGDGPAKRVGEP